MSFQLSQLVFVVVIFFFFLYVFRVRTLITDRIIYLILVSGGILLVIFPDLSTWIANLIGIGRGADLLLYVFVVFSLFRHANVASKLRGSEHQITTIVRKLAIAEAKNGASLQEKITD